MRNRTIAYFSLISALIAPRAIEAAPACREPIAKIASAQGRVDVKTYGNLAWLSINKEDSLCPGDALRTSRWSRATLSLKSGAVLSVDQNTTMSFSAPVKNDPSWFINLLEGSTFFRSRQPQRLDIQTPFINAVHKGTEFMVAVSNQQAEISVFDGQVAGENRSGKVTIDKGFKGIAEAGRQPRVQTLKITPEDAVQWMLYYPPIIDDSPSSQPAINSQVNAALTAYRLGDSNLALTKLDEIPVTQQDTRYLMLKAALLLTVGRVDEAQPLIQQAQHLQPNNSDAYALQGIIAVTKNQQQAALELANKSVIANPQSSVAKIAQSYAYQALFNIDQAFKATQEATRLTPDNALAWARLSELQLSQGDHDAALKSAQKAQTLNPKIARTQTILGFAGLAQTDIEDAKRAFEQALTIDSSDPLARLGLGLAKIRAGDLEEGKNELEIAVNLDPNNAVIRSYLGKAYYELRNKGYAGKEFEIAKEMDPKDPTPYFYDAILKQTTNRPVEALHDMQKAKELNDNRAVYRSSLLLDKDLAARSAAQGRIYNELGFQQQGLLEGWKSVNQDSSNYSAHRLLADNYAALPRHEIARVSELLQSQLLQPVNITPIQPNLGESNLFVLNGLGPSDLSYNEFNPLFEYNRFAFQASGLYGSNNTLGDNTTISGLHDNVSFSLGQFHYETDGFRENNFLKKDLYNAFVQAQVTDDLNLQAEYRHEDRDNGDLALNFDINNFSNDYREHRMLDSYRLGGKYGFSPNSSLIGSLIYQEVSIDQKTAELLDIGLPFLIPVNKEINTKRRGFISELQHIYEQPDYTLINGFGHINQTLDEESLLEDSPPDDKIVTPTTSLTRTNLYNYSKINLLKNLRATFGLSVDFFNRGDFKQSPINPKFGFEWSPLSSLTLRAAAFRSMSVTRTSNQTIEPTQVAGFNQYFDDIDGTVAWRYGAGLDYKYSGNIATGLEYSERKLDIPGGTSEDRTEQAARSYINFTPNDKLAFSIEYFYERINHPGRPIAFDNTLNGGLFDIVETHRIPLTVSFYHPSGLSFKIKNSFIHQSGQFQYLDSLTSSSKYSDFFVVDLNMNYRLPKRYGILSLGINNLFNDHFNFQNTNANETILSPSRTLYSRITIAF